MPASLPWKQDIIQGSASAIWTTSPGASFKIKYYGHEWCFCYVQVGDRNVLGRQDNEPMPWRPQGDKPADPQFPSLPPQGTRQNHEGVSSFIVLQLCLPPAASSGAR